MLKNIKVVYCYEKMKQRAEIAISCRPKDISMGAAAKS